MPLLVSALAFGIDDCDCLGALECVLWKHLVLALVEHGRLEK